MPKVALHTLGCKLNFAETSSLGGQFLDQGFHIVEFGTPADVVLINTCSVTERADRECRQLIRRALRTSGNAVVVVTGCYAQLAPEEVASIEGVDLVLGAKEKFSLFDYLGSIEKRVYPQVFVSDVGDALSFGAAMSGPATERTRGYLKIQDGCDYQCSFCTIPRARGVSRSQPLHDCVLQARELVRQGFKEIVLTGVNVGDYGRKIGTSLAALLHGIAGVDGLKRVRISSIEPNLLTDEILDIVRDSPLLCKHLHVPLQSGSDSILKNMRRRYSAGVYRDRILAAKESIPECGIGADVIVGFPGETDADFEDTYRLLNDLPISYLHVFTFSERPHAQVPSSAKPVEPKVRARRNEMLRILSQKKRHAFYQTMVGTTTSILTETEIVGGQRRGLTGNYVRVGIPEEAAPENQIVDVTVTGVRDDVCVGVPMNGGGAA